MPFITVPNCKIHINNFRNPLTTTQKTHCYSIPNINLLILFREWFFIVRITQNARTYDVPNCVSMLKQGIYRDLKNKTISAPYFINYCTMHTQATNLTIRCVIPGSRKYFFLQRLLTTHETQEVYYSIGTGLLPPGNVKLTSGFHLM